MPNLRYTARGRPHSRQRFLRRVLNFGGFSALAIFDLLATWIWSWNLDFHLTQRESAKPAHNRQHLTTLPSHIASNSSTLSIDWPFRRYPPRLGSSGPYAAAPSRRNGMPNARSSSLDSSSELPEQQIVMFIPCTRVYLSGLISGNTSCSLNPRL